MKSSGRNLGSLTILVGVLGLVSPVAGQSGSCPSLGGVIAGCILGTLALVGIIIAIVLLVQRKRKQHKARPRAASKTGDAGLTQAHINPAFQEEPTSSPEKPTEKANDISFAEKGFGGYVPCREYTSTTTKESSSPPRINGNVQPKWSPKPTKLPTYGIGGKMTKTGSRGSLDDGYPSLAVHSSAIELSKMHTLDPEVINVALQSQDIIGLGFNICGNLRDGIYVSQVHNRGPASESGRIKPGDRILGITISFENTVYEDALTILSYASPYPVQLQIQKKQQKSDSDVTGEDYEEALHLHHPVYRSQSMDDVSKIAQESVFRVRRARSEMKRGSSKSRKQEEEIEEGKLRKWSGKPDFGEPVSTTDVVSDEKSEDSNVSIPDLRLDPADLSASYNADSEVIEATVHQEADRHSLDIAQAMEGAINLEEISLEKTEAPTLGLSPKRQSELDRMEGLRLSYEADMPVVRKLDLDKGVPSETSDEVKDAIDGFSQDREKDFNAQVGVDVEAKSYGLRGKRRDSNSSSGSESKAVTAEKVRRISSAETDEARSEGEEGEPREGEPSIQFVPDVGQEVSLLADVSSGLLVTEHDDFIEIDLKSSKHEAASDDAPSGPPSPPPGPPPPLSDNAADVAESSMHVLLNEESIMLRDKSQVEGEVKTEDEETQDADDSIQDVLKDYFSDQPSLMARLGLSAGKAEMENVTLPKRLSGSDNRSERSEKSSDHDSVDVSVTHTNGKALHEAKMLIRRKSSSDEEPVHVSSSPSLSSRSSSPMEETGREETQEEQLEAEEVKETKAAKISYSPVVTKRSSGGITFDVDPRDYGEMATEMHESNRQKKQGGGMAYYYSIEEQFQDAPIGDAIGVDEHHPSLVKALGLPNMSATTPQYEVDDHPQENRAHVTEVTMIDTDTRTTTTTTTKVLELSNNNNDLGVNGNEKGNEIPLSPTVRSKDLQTEVSKSSDVITVVPHDEVRGAFTLTMNTSHHEDSEA